MSIDRAIDAHQTHEIADSVLVKLVAEDSGQHLVLGRDSWDEDAVEHMITDVHMARHDSRNKTVHRFDVWMVGICREIGNEVLFGIGSEPILDMEGRRVRGEPSGTVLTIKMFVFGVHGIV